jgi:hypothetical protein
MLSRHLPARRASSLALAVLLSGLPSLAAAAGPATPAVPAGAAPLATTPIAATPIADAARAAVNQYGYHGHDNNDALMWTGFGLIAGGASLIAVGAVIDNEDCFDNGIAYHNCDDVRKAAYVTGGIMAGVGVGLMVMASHSGHHHHGHGHYPSITMQRGRMIVQQPIRF